MGLSGRDWKIIAALVGAMTFGAGILLVLEPERPQWSSASLLMAEGGEQVREMRIDYASGLADCVVSDFDGLILPDGTCHWRPESDHLRVCVVGDGDARLSEQQAQKLLALFGSLKARRDFSVRCVWLHPSSDARLHPELPPAAYDLCDLLVRKGIIP